MTEPQAMPAQLLEDVRAFAEDLGNRLGPNLLSVTVYGSAARGDYVEGVSDVNALVIAQDLPASELRAAGAVVRAWRERMPLAPLFATPDYLETSADVFPLEFLDMSEAHVTVRGTDPLAGLTVDLRLLRHQVETEMKGKLLRLRSAYARVAGQPAAVRQLMRDSLSSFRALFDGVLRLHGQRPPLHRADVMRAAASLYDLDAEALDAVVAVHAREASADDEADVLFGRYLAAVERMVQAVDAWSDATETGARA